MLLALTLYLGYCSSLLLAYLLAGLQVFQVEQGYRSEFDDLDKDSAIHFIAEVPATTAQERGLDETSAEFCTVAAGRFYQVLYEHGGNSAPDGPSYPLEMVFRIGRVCCLKPVRGLGIGHLILGKMIDTAKRLGANKLVLHAQADKVAFYAKEGFAVIQLEGQDWCFEDEGKPHVGMQMLCDAL